jgi:hypothetical protein
MKDSKELATLWLPRHADATRTLWRLVRPENGPSEDETLGRPTLYASHTLGTASPTGLAAISIGPVAPLTYRLLTHHLISGCFLRRTGATGLRVRVPLHPFWNLG